MDKITNSVRDFLAQNGLCTIKEMATHCQRDPGVIQRVMRELISNGDVARTPHPKRKDHYLYSLKPKPYMTEYADATPRTVTFRPLGLYDLASFGKRCSEARNSSTGMV